MKKGILLGLIFAVMLVNTVNAYGPDPDADHILYYKFDEGTGTNVSDSSATGYDGTMIGGSSWNSSGKFGYGGNFNGSIWVNATEDNAATMRLTTALTLEAWVYYNGGGSGNKQIINKFHYIVPNYYGYLLSLNDSNNVNFGFGLTTAGNKVVGSTYPIETNKWYYIVATFNQTGATLWINGVENETITFSSDTIRWLDDPSIRIGSAEGSGSEYFYGIVDEAAVSDIQRGSAYITSNYAFNENRTYLIVNSPSDGSSVDSDDGYLTFDLNVTGNTSASIYYSIDGSSQSLINSSAWLFNGDLFIDYGTHTITFNATGNGQSVVNVTVTVYYGVINVSIFDEMTNIPFNISATNTTILTVQCPTSVTHETFTAYSQNVSIGCELDFLKLDITMDDIKQFRTLEPSGGDEAITFYMINTTQYTARAINEFLIDTLGTYGGSTLTVYKPIGDTSKEIITQVFDAENKVTLYLIDGENYILEINNGILIQNKGYLLADSTLTKYVSVSEVPYFPSYADKVLMKDVIWYFTADYDLKTVGLVYNDTQSETTSVTFTVYNGSNISQELYTYTTNENYYSFSYNFVDENISYLLELSAINNIYNTLNDKKIVSPEIKRITIGSLPSSWYYIISIMALIGIGTAFGLAHRLEGSIIVTGFAAFFWYLGWLDIYGTTGYAIIALITMLSISQKMTEEGRI